MPLSAGGHEIDEYSPGDYNTLGVRRTCPARHPVEREHCERMKRIILAALAAAWLLSGCGGTNQKAQDFSQWQQEAAGAAEIGFTAEITATWDDGSAAYTAQVERTGGETATTVTAPETIAGVSFRSREGDTALEFDGVILNFTPGAEIVPPCEAGSILLDAVCRGNLLYSGADGEFTTAAVAAPGGETVTLWRTEEGVPVYAEIARGERTELILSIENWKMGE